jgi:2,4-dienoyl-CoA reductase (NADPH2)
VRVSRRASTRIEPLAIEAEGLRYRDGEGERVSPADAVLVASEIAPDRALADALDARGIACHVVGDCAEVALLDGAIRTAAAVGASL